MWNWSFSHAGTLAPPRGTVAPSVCPIPPVLDSRDRYATTTVDTAYGFLFYSLHSPRMIDTASVRRPLFLAFAVLAVVSIGTSGLAGIGDSNGPPTLPSMEFASSYDGTTAELSVQYTGEQRYSRSDFRALNVSRVVDSPQNISRAPVRADSGYSSNGVWVGPGAAAGRFPFEPGTALTVHDVQANETIFLAVSKRTNDGNVVNARVVTIDIRRGRAIP